MYLMKLLTHLAIWSCFIMAGFVHAITHTTTPRICDDPKPATDLAVIIYSHTSFKLTWYGPSNVVENCVHGYNLTITADNGKQQQSYSVWHNYYINDRYQPFVPTLCTNYTATVFVEGYPGVSNTSSIRFYIGPARPRSLKASNTTSTQTHLSWEEPATLSCANHYKLYHCAYDVGSTEQDCNYKTEIVHLTANSTRLSGLHSCKKHHIRLATVDNFGGESYVATTIHTGNDDPPAVSEISIQDNQGFSVNVSWPTPVQFNPQCHGGYRVCSISKRDGMERCYFTDKNWLKVGKLTACTNYTIQVQTVDGDLDESSTRSAAKSLHIFTNPQIPATTVEASSNEKAILTFGNPDSFTTSCLRNYEIVECVEISSLGECEVLNNYTLPVNTTSFNSSELIGCATSILTFYAVADNGGKSYLDLTFIRNSGTLQPPSNMSVVTANTEQLILAWTPPDFDKCPRSYRVCVTRLKNDRHCASTDSESGDIFYNLNTHPCYSYTVKVWAMYKKKSSFTTSVNFTIGPNNAEKQMMEVTSTTVQLSWQRYTAAHRCNTGYRITWCEASIFSYSCDQAPLGSVNLTDTTAHYNITGLETCGKYLIVFQTLGRGDLSSAPNATFVHTPIGEFGAITDLTVHQQKNNTVVLDVVFPNNSTKCITTFTTCLYEAGSKNPEKYCRLMRTTWVGKTTKPCTNYTIDITAITYNKLTSNGSITFRTGPNGVRDVAVQTVGTDAVNVTWINHGKQAISCVEYLEVIFYPEESSGPAVEVRIPANSTSILLEALSNCTTYNFQIQAVTEEGIRSPLVFKKFKSSCNGASKGMDNPHFQTIFLDSGSPSAVAKQFHVPGHSNGAHSTIIKDVTVHIGLLLCVLQFHNHRILKM